MNKLILYFVIVFFVGISCDKDEISTGQADKFIKYYGGLAADHGNDVKQLPGGGYFIVGTITVGDNETDIFTLITDKYGNSVSDLKTFDGNNLNDKISRMQLLDDGGAVAIGTLQRTLTNNDIWLMRFDSGGDTVWTRKFGKSYGDDEGYNLIIDQSGNIVAVGYIDSLTSTGVHNKQIWIHTISQDGTEFWPNENKIGYESYDLVANSIIEVDDGYVLVGSINPKNSSRNILFSYTTEKGKVRRITKIQSEYDDQGIAITRLADGNFLILGTRTNVSNNTSDILLLRIEVPLNEFEQIKVLDKKILDDGENESASCFIYKNNQVHILGTTVESTRTNTRKILLIATDESGNNPQYFRYGFKNTAMEGFGMDYTSDGGYVFTGSHLVLYKIKDSGEL